MEPRLSFVTLGVSNLERSVRFYEKVLRVPASAFGQVDRILRARPRRGSRSIRASRSPRTSASPRRASGFVGFTLAHNVHSAKEVDRVMAELEAAGHEDREAARRPADWGGYSGYFEDPDGFLWEIAYNPHFPHT